MINLNNLTNAQFLDSKKVSGCDNLPCFSCDAGPLPPGCDCFCDTPCDFGRNQKINDSGYFQNSKVYEIE